MATFYVNTEDARISNAFLATLGAYPGATYLSQVKAFGLTNSVNAMISATGKTVASDLASVVSTNLGLTGVAASAAQAYLSSNTFTGTKSAAWGSNLMSALDLFTSLQSDATFGAAASAYAARINMAVSYSLVATNVSTDLATLQSVAGSAASGSGSRLVLSDDPDTLSGTALNDTFYASAVTALDTGDSLNGLGGVDTLEIRVDDALTASPDLRSIEIIKLTKVADDVDLTGTDLSAVTTLQIDDLRGDAAVSADSMPDTISITNMFSGGSAVSADASVDLTFAFDDSTDESLTLSLNKAGVLNRGTGEGYNIVGLAVDNGGDITDLTINVSGPNYILLEADGVTSDLEVIETLVVKGTGDLILFEDGTASFNDLKTIDASGLVGGLQMVPNQNTTTAVFNDFDGSGDIEVVKGGSGADLISLDVDGSDVTYIMGAGNDVVNDNGSDGDNVYEGGDGNDTIRVSSGDVTVKGGAGNDTVRFADNQLNDDDSVEGGDGVDTLRFDISDADAVANLIDDKVVTGFETLRFDAADTNDAYTIDMDDFDGFSSIVVGWNNNLNDVTFDNVDSGLTITAIADADGGTWTIDNGDDITLVCNASAVAGAAGNADLYAVVTDVDDVFLTATATGFYSAAVLAGNPGSVARTAESDLAATVDNADTLTISVVANAGLDPDGAASASASASVTATDVDTITATLTANAKADNGAFVALSLSATTVEDFTLTLNATGRTSDNATTADIDLGLDDVETLTINVNGGYGAVDSTTAATGVDIWVDAAITTNEDLEFTVNVADGSVVSSLAFDGASAESVVVEIDLDGVLFASSMTLEDSSEFTLTGSGTIGSLTLTIEDVDASTSIVALDFESFEGDFGEDADYNGIVIDTSDNDNATEITFGALKLASADEAIELDLTDATGDDTIKFSSDMTGAFEIDGFDDTADVLDLSEFGSSYNTTIVKDDYDSDGDSVDDSTIITGKNGKFDFEIILIGVDAGDIGAGNFVW